MSDRLFAPCCYGTEFQHMDSAPCPQSDGVYTVAERARLKLADMLGLAGYAEDAEHLRKPVRVGGSFIDPAVAMAAMIAFAQVSK